MMDGNLIGVTISATIVTGAMSFFGLVPTSRLRKQPRGPVRIIHLLSLPLIVALIYIYLDVVVPHARDTDRLGYTIGCSLVAAFWWLVIAKRAHAAVHPLAIVCYLTSTVLFGFLGPLVISFNAFTLFDNLRPLRPRAPLLLGLVVHLVMYTLVFATTRWFTRISNQSHDIGEPSDAPKDRASRFDNGESFAGPR